MRHLNKHNHLGRTSSHRKAMFSNMAASLIIHKRINTTLAKARALKIYAEPIITKSKEDTTHSRRMAFSYLQDKDAVMELFRTVAPKIATRPGGYLRILKTGARAGDNADMCFVEFVDFNDSYAGIAAKTEETKAKGTTRRGRKKGGADSAKPAKAAEAAAE
jgi:large subunit ribosomal protein L17